MHHVQYGMENYENILKIGKNYFYKKKCEHRLVTIHHYDVTISGDSITILSYKKKSIPDRHEKLQGKDKEVTCQCKNSEHLEMSWYFSIYEACEGRSVYTVAFSVHV